jgi:hypothetical protein
MRKPLLFVGALLCVLVLNVLNLTPLLSRLLYTMTPLQRYYAADYLASSWHRDDPAATTETRPIWKVGKDVTTGKSKAGKGKAEKEKLELATEQDLVALPPRELIGTFSPEPFRLSDEAFAQGWIALRRDNPHEVKSAVLADVLQEQIFNGYSLWRFFRQPALGLVMLFVLWLVVRAWRVERWKRNMWNTVGKKNLSFLAWSLEASDRIAVRLLPRPKVPEILSATLPRKLELQAPASQRVLPASVTSAEAKPTPKPVAAPASVSAPSNEKPTVVEAPVPVPPTVSAKPKAAFVWDESQGID